MWSKLELHSTIGVAMVRYHVNMPSRDYDTTALNKYFNAMW